MESVTKATTGIIQKTKTVILYSRSSTISRQALALARVLKIDQHFLRTVDNFTPKAFLTPDLLIASGRENIEKCKNIKELSQGKTQIVYFGKDSSDVFDICITNEADMKAPEGLFGFFKKPKEVNDQYRIVTKGFVNDISPQFLSRFHMTFSPKLPQLPFVKNIPKILLLIGAPTSKVKYDLRYLISASNAIKKFSKSHQIIVSYSPRASQEIKNCIKNTLGSESVIYIDYNRSQYLQALVAADYVIVTADSMTMTSEALATGKPVMTLFEKCCSGEVLRFHESLRATQYTRVFQEKLETWDYEPLVEGTKIIAPRVRSLILKNRNKTNQQS